MMLTQADTEAELERLSNRLEDLTRDLAPITRAAAEAETVYRMAYALAFTQAEGAMAYREQAALLMEVDVPGYMVTGPDIRDPEGRVRVLVADWLHQRKMTEAVLIAQQEAIRSVRAQLSAVQTVSANVRAQT